MPKNITHGWSTALPDNPDYDVSADELNDHAEVYSGLTAGQVLRASSTTAADFAALQDGDIPATIARDSEVTTAVSGHVTDEHTGLATDVEVATAVSDHAAAANPHPTYETSAEAQAKVDAAISALSTVYQPLDSDLTAIAALTTTTYGRALLALADASAGRTALGLGTAAVAAIGDFDAAGAAAAAAAASQPVDSDLTAIAALSTTAFGRGLLALADAAALRTAAGLVIGTDVSSQAAVTVHETRIDVLEAAATALTSVYGAVGDGTTNDTAAFQAALNAGIPLIVRDTFLVTALTVPAGSRIYFAGGELKASGANVVLTITGNDVEIHDLAIDLNSQSYRAVFANLRDSVRLLGDFYIHGAKAAGTGTLGIVLFDTCTNVRIGDGLIDGFFEINSTTFGLYRGIELFEVDGFSVGNVVFRNGDIGLNLWAATNGTVASVTSRDLTNNGVYIQDDSGNIHFGSIYTNNTLSAGVVLASTRDDARITIDSVTSIDCDSSGLDPRTGGGYTFGIATLVESRIRQNTTVFPLFCHHVTIGVLNMQQPAGGTGVQPFWLERNTHWRIGMMVVATNVATDPITFQDCDYIDIGALHLQGLAGTAITQGVFIDDDTAPVADPHIDIRQFTAQNVTTAYLLNTAVKTNVFVEFGNDRIRDLTVKRDGPATLQIERTNTGLTAGDIIGSLKFRGNDGTNPGVKFNIEVQAAGGLGGDGIAIFRNGSGTEVGRVGPPSAPGMSIKLPTVSTSLTSGMIWNNAGVITIVP